ncbi:hypothetical protein C0971_08850 [Bacillus methanolicus]|nr:hypothetical protein C0971_08850 [Bacillus methanolicus]
MDSKLCYGALSKISFCNSIDDVGPQKSKKISLLNFSNFLKEIVISTNHPQDSIKKMMIYLGKCDNDRQFKTAFPTN